MSLRLRLTEEAQGQFVHEEGARWVLSLAGKVLRNGAFRSSEEALNWAYAEVPHLRPMLWFAKGPFSSGDEISSDQLEGPVSLELDY